MSIMQTTYFDYYINPEDICTNTDFLDSKFTIGPKSCKTISVGCVMWRETRVWMKIVPKSLELMNELRILSKCIHPKVCQFLGSTQSQKTKQVQILFEYMENGDLYSYIKKYPELSVVARYRILLDIAQALHYLHNRKPDGILHRDLKPHNVLVSINGEAKICDFGVSKLVSQIHSPFGHSAEKGTYTYMAPEVICGKYYNSSADIYSLGVLIYYVMSGKCPWKSMSPVQIVVAKSMDRLSIPPIGIEVIDELITSCTHTDFKKRCCAKDVIIKIRELLQQ